MKKILHGFGVFALLCLTLYPSVSSSNGLNLSCTNDECAVELYTDCREWFMEIECTDGDSGTYSGVGHWTGSLCGYVDVADPC